MEISARSTSLIIPIMVCITYALAGEANDFYNELPLSSADEVQLTSNSMDTPRLLNLLRMKQSMSDLLSSSSGSTSGDGHLMGVPGLHKRVFCNGFTGCGGRFRGRRRQQLQQPVAEIGKRLLPVYTKKPFCNTFGCQNGKKRSQEDVTEIRDDDSQLGHDKMVAFDDGWSSSKFKRLFCNGYGGCQNHGKRMAFLGSASATDMGSKDEGLLPFSTKMSDKFADKKRFFSSPFDEDVNAVIDNL